ncbi:MAG: UDP-glucose 4-epimerase GalE [Clostridia bacterium]|nr:UDP-glucose 4-epimerase GalE [Clostridia bacterium]
MILVTGMSGYIGSHTAVALLKAGKDIVGFDNFYNSSFEAVKAVESLSGRSFPFYEADLRDIDSMERIFKEHNIDAVVHFAGLKAVGESVAKPLFYYENNICGTVNLLKLMEKYGVMRFVFSSSATVYGEPKSVPINEDFPLSTTNPYGSTKLYIEGILKDMCKANKEFSVALLRYFNPIGAHESGLIGENPNGIPNNLMPRICQTAKGIMKSLTVFGDDYPTPDGTGVRDYIHVCDLADGHIAALDKIEKDTGVHIYNLGTGKGYSVYDLIHTFARVNGVEVPYTVCPRRPGDVPEMYSDPSKAKAELGWEARLGLEDMCRSSWSFIKDK